VGEKMNKDFQKGLERKRILVFEKAKLLVNKELEDAADDLTEAMDRLENKKYKYATITAYYSMFHTVRALVYSRGYREKSHYYLLVAVQALFVDKGLMEESLVKDFHTAMILREEADYHGDFSEEGAKSSLDAARTFLKKAKKILI
jgi:uncharacterized protein (UPF0332 family)